MPYKDKEKARQCSREAAKRYKSKHHKLGLCENCSNRVVTGASLCENCRKKNRVRSSLNHIKLYYKRKEQKKCQKCDNPAIENHVYCEAHLAENNQYSRDLVYERQSNALCRQCGLPVVEGKTFCHLHLSQCIVRSRRRYRDNPEYAEQVKQTQRKRVDKLKAENKCVRCSMPLNSESRMGVLCLTCYSKYNGYF